MSIVAVMIAMDTMDGQDRIHRVTTYEWARNPEKSSGQERHDELENFKGFMEQVAAETMPHERRRKLRFRFVTIRMQDDKTYLDNVHDWVGIDDIDRVK